MPIALITLLSLAVFVSATLNIDSSGDLVNEVYINKGWNIVMGITGEDILSTSEITSENLKAVWYYSPTTSEYLEMHPNLDSGKFRDTGLDDDYILTSAMWVYSDKEGTLKYNPNDDILIENIDLDKNRQLYKGYNFVTVTSNMVGETLEEIKGNCIIEKAYWWDNGGQDWVFWDDEALRYNENTGKGFIVRVSDDCKFMDKVGGTTQPPQIPGTQTGCSDTDGGLNYYVKGIGYDEEDYADGANENCFTTQRYNHPVLSEVYCEGNELKRQTYDCAVENKICKEGACVEGQQESYLIKENIGDYEVDLDSSNQNLDFISGGIGDYVVQEVGREDGETIAYDFEGEAVLVGVAHSSSGFNFQQELSSMETFNCDNSHQGYYYCIHETSGEVPPLVIWISEDGYLIGLHGDAVVSSANGLLNTYLDKYPSLDVQDMF